MVAVVDSYTTASAADASSSQQNMLWGRATEGYWTANVLMRDASTQQRSLLSWAPLFIFIYFIKKKNAGFVICRITRVFMVCVGEPSIRLSNYPSIYRTRDCLFLLGFSQIRSDVFIQLWCVDQALREQERRCRLIDDIRWMSPVTPLSQPRSNSSFKLLSKDNRKQFYHRGEGEWHVDRLLGPKSFFFFCNNLQQCKVQVSPCFFLLLFLFFG